jgi:hypothetical protein
LRRSEVFREAVVRERVDAARAHAVRIARELEAEGQFEAFAVKVTDEQGTKWRTCR